MKLRKFLALVLVLAVMLAGCGEEAFDDAAIRADAEVLLAAFLNEDYDACRGIVDESVSDADLQGIFPAVAAELADLGEYEMTAVGWNRKLTGEKDQISVNYLVSGEGGKYYLSVAKLEGTEGLAGFQISEAGADAEPTAPEGLIHRAFTIVGAATLCFVLWMAVDCLRRKMKRKWLWIPLILLGAVVLIFTVRDGGMSFRYNIGLYLGLTSLTTYAAGGFQVKLFLPLAAIVYFLKRRQLTQTAEAAEA